MIAGEESGKWSNFSATEQHRYTDLLRRVLGTEGLGYDKYCDVDVETEPKEIRWYCDYAVSGYNYCAETEYTKTVILRLPVESKPWEGFEKASAIDFRIDCQGVDELVELLSSSSKAVWVRGIPEEAGYRLRSDVTFLFEDLDSTGKTFWLRYVEDRREPW